MIFKFNDTYTDLITGGSAKLINFGFHVRVYSILYS